MGDIQIYFEKKIVVSRKVLEFRGGCAGRGVKAQFFVYVGFHVLGTDKISSQSQRCLFGRVFGGVCREWPEQGRVGAAERSDHSVPLGPWLRRRVRAAAPPPAPPGEPLTPLFKNGSSE